MYYWVVLTILQCRLVLKVPECWCACFWRSQVSKSSFTLSCSVSRKPAKHYLESSSDMKNILIATLGYALNFRIIAAISESNLSSSTFRITLQKSRPRVQVYHAHIRRSRVHRCWSQWKMTYFQHFSTSRRFAHFCIASNSIRQPNFGEKQIFTKFLQPTNSKFPEDSPNIHTITNMH